MADFIRWGILSTAKIGKDRVIPAMHKASNGKVVAVGSRDLGRAKAFAQETNIPIAYGSYEELIASPEVDAIYNPLPNSEHAEWSIKCAEAGKPVLCEKPLASNAAEAQKMIDAFASHNVLFAEAFMWRFHPQSQRVKQMVDDGAVGEMRVIEAALTFPIGSEDDIRLSKALAGGSLMDLGCYCVSVMRFMTGEEPDKVAAFADFGERSQVDEVTTGMLTFPSGVYGHFDCSLRLEFTNMYDIRGTKGRILVENGFVIPPTQDTRIRYWSGGSYDEIVIPMANEYTLMAEDFADSLLKGRPPRFPVQESVAQMTVLDRLIESATK
jgi:predicted dehydrogenase